MPTTSLTRAATRKAIRTKAKALAAKPAKPRAPSTRPLTLQEATMLETQILLHDARGLALTLRKALNGPPSTARDLRVLFTTERLLKVLGA